MCGTLGRHSKPVWNIGVAPPISATKIRFEENLKKIVTSKITSFFGFPLVLAIIDAISSSILNVNVINQLKEAICVGNEEETGEVG